MLLETIKKLRAQFSELEEFTRSVNEFAEPGVDESSIRASSKQGLQLAVRAVATLGLVESGLDNLYQELAQSQQKLRELEDGTSRWIFFLAQAVGLLMLWMAAGQFSLCKSGWQGIRSSRSV